MEKIAAKKSKFLPLEYLISEIGEKLNVYPLTKVFIVGDGDDKYRLYVQAKVKDLELKNYI